MSRKKKKKKEKEQIQQLLAHVGGLVRPYKSRSYGDAPPHDGKVGLLLSAEPWSIHSSTVRVELLIDGSVRVCDFYVSELELIGADSV
jgi:hypothetical protein